MVVQKYEIEAALYTERQDIAAGRLREDNPLDASDGFEQFCEAVRRGDLRYIQERISEGVININARDRYDYTPLILSSLCGHYEVAQLLLESGALCEQNTFQGERCVYDALNDRIRNLFLSYGQAKFTHPLQPLSGHVTSLLNRDDLKTSDITLKTYEASFDLHKFVLAARSPYFAKKLESTPDITSWKLSQDIPTQSFETAIRYLYLGEVSADVLRVEEEQTILTGIDKLSKQLEIGQLFQDIVEGTDRRLARQRRSEEVYRGRDQFASWFQNNVLKHKVQVDTSKADDVKWDRNNSIFADVLLRADEPVEEAEVQPEIPSVRNTEGPLNGIPIGSFAASSTSRGQSRERRRSRHSVLFPVHRAMLLRSEFFNAMFTSGFREAQETPHLQIIPIGCTPEVLEIVLTYLYTEKADFSLEIAVEVLFVADMLFIEKLKQRAAVIISTLGNGTASIVEGEHPRDETDIEDLIDIYDVVRAGWDTRVHRLEEFGARYIAYRLERFIDQEEFITLVKESAARIKNREETDTVELIDDIRHYLSQRFSLRMEDSGLDEMMNESAQIGSSGDMTQDTGKDVASPDASLNDERVDVHSGTTPLENTATNLAPTSEHLSGPVIRTLDGGIAGDELAQNAINYQILLGKIDTLLDNLSLDA